MSILKQADSGIPVPELCCEHGVSNAMFYKWRSKYGGMDTSMIGIQLEFIQPGILSKMLTLNVTTEPCAITG